MGAAQHVCDRVHQMRFTQTRVAVDEKRVVLCRRALRNRKGSRMREFVARTDDKTLKCVVVIRRSARARRGVFAGHYNDRDRVAGQVVQHLLQRSDKFGLDKFFLKGYRRVQHQPVIPKGNDRYVVKPSEMVEGGKSSCSSAISNILFAIGRLLSIMILFYNSIFYPQVQCVDVDNCPAACRAAA